MDDVLALNGTVVAGSVSVAGHCEFLVGDLKGERGVEVVDVQLQFERSETRGSKYYILTAMVAVCKVVDHDVKSVIVERLDDHTRRRGAGTWNLFTFSGRGHDNRHTFRSLRRREIGRWELVSSLVEVVCLPCYATGRCPCANNAETRTQPNSRSRW